MSKIEVIRGDDVTLTVTFQDENGTAINLTGSTLYFTVKGDLTATDDTGALISKDVVSHTTPLSGISSVALSNTDTNITAGDYYYDFQLKNSSNKITSTSKGVFSVINDVTKRTT